jgi:hypothetical protein
VGAQQIGDEGDGLGRQRQPDLIDSVPSSPAASRSTWDRSSTAPSTRRWDGDAITVFRDAEAAAAYEATVVQRELGWSFRRHVELALKVAGAEDLHDAVRFTGEMGITGAVAALEALEEVLADHPSGHG